MTQKQLIDEFRRRLIGFNKEIFGPVPAEATIKQVVLAANILFRDLVREVGDDGVTGAALDTLIAALA